VQSDLPAANPQYNPPADFPRFATIGGTRRWKSGSGHDGTAATMFNSG